jgi:hypothetical protein
LSWTQKDRDALKELVQIMEELKPYVERFRLIEALTAEKQVREANKVDYEI